MLFAIFGKMRDLLIVITKAHIANDVAVLTLGEESFRNLIMEDSGMIVPINTRLITIRQDMLKQFAMIKPTLPINEVAKKENIVNIADTATIL